MQYKLTFRILKGQCVGFKAIQVLVNIQSLWHFDTWHLASLKVHGVSFLVKKPFRYKMVTVRNAYHWLISRQVNSWFQWSIALQHHKTSKGLANDMSQNPHWVNFIPRNSLILHCDHNLWWYNLNISQLPYMVCLLFFSGLKNVWITYYVTMCLLYSAKLIEKFGGLLPKTLRYWLLCISHQLG